MGKKKCVDYVGVCIRRDVILCEVAMTTYVLYLIITNNSNVWVGSIFGFSPWGVNMLFLASRIYGLCRLHKMMIIHISAVTGCIILHYEIGWGELLPIMRWLMFSSGAFLMGLLAKQEIKKYRVWTSRRNCAA